MASATLRSLFDRTWYSVEEEKGKKHHRQQHDYFLPQRRNSAGKNVRLIYKVSSPEKTKFSPALFAPSNTKNSCNIMDIYNAQSPKQGSRQKVPEKAAQQIRLCTKGNGNIWHSPQ